MSDNTVLSLTGRIGVQRLKCGMELVAFFGQHPAQHVDLRCVLGGDGGDQGVQGGINNVPILFWEPAHQQFIDPISRSIDCVRHRAKVYRT